MGSIREVRKRDDRVVPFNADKITDAVYKAVRSVGKGTRSTAEELSAAVVHFLDKRFGKGIPGIEEIQDVVETVLIETGHAEVAKAYILYRNKRGTMREALEVRKPRAHDLTNVLEKDSGPWVEEQKELVSRWSKSKIAAALVREADMDLVAAEEVASAVERKVFESGIQRISTSLVRELVDNELFERGFNAKLQRQAPLGLPKYNLEQIIFGLDSKEGYFFPKTPVEVREFIANRILRQYALQEVYSPAVADAHRDGVIHLHQLEDPVRFSDVCWNLPFPLVSNGALPPDHFGNRIGRDQTARQDFGRRKHDRGDSARRDPGRRDDVEQRAAKSRWSRSKKDLEPIGNVFDDTLFACLELKNEQSAGDSFLDHRDLVRRLCHLGQFVHDEIRLRHVDRLIVDPDGAVGGTRVRSVIERLLEVQHTLVGSRLAIELEPSDVSRLLLEELFSQSRGEKAVKLYLHWSPYDMSDSRRRPTIELAAELFSRGLPVEFLPALHERAQDHADEGGTSRHGTTVGGRRQSGVLAFTSKVSINLPQAAFRSAKRRSGRIEDELEEALDLALKAFLERRHFLSRLGANRENPLWDLLGRPQDIDGAPMVATESGRCRVGLLGLNECVKFLTGFEFQQDPRALEKGKEIVSEVWRKIQRAQRGFGLEVELEETQMLGGIRRLETADRQRFPQFEEILRGRTYAPEETTDYTGGVRIHPAAPVDPLRRLEHLARFLSEVSPRGVLDDSPELRSAEAGLVVCLLEEAASVFTHA